METLSVIESAIMKAKAMHFKQAVAKAAGKRREIWALEKEQKKQALFPQLPYAVLILSLILTLIKLFL